MDAQVRQDIPITAYFESSSGPITGVLDMKVTIINRTTGLTLVDGGDMAEVVAGSGHYLYTMPSAVNTAPARLQIFVTSASYALYEESHIKVGVVPSWMQTKRDLRMAIARMVDGPRGVIDARASDGTTTTAVVPSLVYGGYNEYAGRYARVSFESGAYFDRLVLESDDETSAITFDEALPFEVTSNTRIELYVTPPGDIDNAIRMAIDASVNHVLIPFEERMIVTDGVASAFEVPSEVEQITELHAFDGGTFMGRVSDRQWMLSGSTLYLGNWRGSEPIDPYRFGASTSMLSPMRAGYTILLRGMTRADYPHNDDGYVEVNPEYIVYYARYYLAQSRQDLAPLIPFYKRLADEARVRA